MTAPRWITEALESVVLTDDVVTMLQGESAAINGRYRLLPEAIDAAAGALIERLPIEAMARAGCEAVASTHLGGPMGAALAVVSGIVTLLVDGDPEVVRLVEVHRGACRALDAAGVPCSLGDDQVRRILDVGERITWLAQQRRARLELDRVTAELAAVTRELEQLRGTWLSPSDAAALRADRDAAVQYAADLQSQQGRAP